MKHHIIYATGPEGSIKKSPEGYLFLKETMLSQLTDRQILESGEMTPEEAANKCMMAYVQIVRMRGIGDDPVEVHTYINDEDGCVVAFTASWSDGSETIVCRVCEQP